MPVQTGSKSQRDILVETGTAMFHARGYTATGVREIAVAAGLPTGSFTNHFRSKERFGAEVLDHYSQRLEAIMANTLLDRTQPPRERILAYFAAIEQSMSARGWEVGCLIPDLAGEALSHSEVLRERLASIMTRHSGYFAENLQEIFDQETADDLAATILAAWHGTLLRMKVERSGKPIARFRRFVCRLMDQNPKTL